MKKVVASILSVLTVASCFAGVACGPTTGDVDPNALVIEYYKAGYGSEWITNLAVEHKKRTGQEVVLLPRSGQAGLEAMSTSLTSGTAETDLFFASSPSFANVYRGKVSANGKTYDSWYADLTDVYTSKIEGENITVGDKMFDYFEEYFKMGEDGKYYDNNYYFFPYVTGAIGIVVNVDVWNRVVGANVEYPRTTNELLELCENVKGDVAPFIYSLEDEYWTATLPLFMNQYEGNARMDKFYQGYGPDEESRYENGMVEYDGFKYALEFFAELLDGSKYMHKDSKSLGFMQMQGAFLGGNALFNVNGDWLEREMITNYPNANIEMMKTPILSAIVEKCSFVNDANKETILRNIIDYVDDKTTTAPTGCTPADIEIIRAARSVEYVTGTGNTAFVPSYSNQIDNAKKFLKMMASDDGMLIFRNGTNGCEMPFNYTDTTKGANPNASVFRKSVNNVLGSSTARFVNQKDKIFSIGGLNVMLFSNQYGRFVNAFTSGNATAEQYFNAEVAKVDSMLDAAKRQANIG